MHLEQELLEKNAALHHWEAHISELEQKEASLHASVSETAVTCQIFSFLMARAEEWGEKEQERMLFVCMCVHMCMWIPERFIHMCEKVARKDLPNWVSVIKYFINFGKALWEGHRKQLVLG